MDFGKLEETTNKLLSEATSILNLNATSVRERERERSKERNKPTTLSFAKARSSKVVSTEVHNSKLTQGGE